MTYEIEHQPEQLIDFLNRPIKTESKVKLVFGDKFEIVLNFAGSPGLI